MIDTLNILEATKKAMMMAIKNLQIFPDYVLMDGMKPDFVNISGEAVVKGDSKSLSIAAASIIAKVFRDQFITKISQFFPVYDLAKNKGYPTQKHRESIHIHGQTFFHRRSFRIKGWQKTKEQV